MKPAEPGRVRGEAPDDKLTQHRKMCLAEKRFGVESQNLLHNKVYAQSGSALGKDNTAQRGHARLKENQAPRGLLQVKASERPEQHREGTGRAASRTESSTEKMEHLQDTSAGRSYFEQIKLQGLAHRGRRGEPQSREDAPGAQEEPAEQQKPVRVAVQDRAQPSLVITEDESKQQRAPLTPCCPAIRQSLLSWKHASGSGGCVDQPFERSSHNLSMNFHMSEPHSAMPFGLGGKRAQRPDQGWEPAGTSIRQVVGHQPG